MSFICNFSNVISIELDENTANMLVNNLNATSKILNCNSNYIVLNGDFISLKNSSDIFPEKVDVVFFDPPWGGRNYMNRESLRLKLSGRFMSEICNEVRSITKYIVLKYRIYLFYNFKYSYGTGTSTVR